MKKISRVFTILFVGLFFAVMTIVLLILFVGAIRFVYSFVTETVPTVYEVIGAIFVMLVGGAIGVLLYLKDAGE